jgi:hypothetical protein
VSSPSCFLRDLRDWLPEDHLAGFVIDAVGVMAPQPAEAPAALRGGHLSHEGSPNTGSQTTVAVDTPPTREVRDSLA